MRSNEPQRLVRQPPLAQPLEEEVERFQRRRVVLPLGPVAIVPDSPTTQIVSPFRATKDTSSRIG